MSSSTIKGWWRDRRNQNPQRSVSVAICPCNSCFNGTGHIVEKSYKRPNTMASLKQRNSRGSLASDFVPLCSDAQSISGFTTTSETLV
ncbi:hypothetical protein F5X96DRAFT_667170 [Biscogniauxia mediterranea]|nr:hypothetical protein F5X96DRAFT_667170 [Biscogniauxia mediterranea]